MPLWIAAAAIAGGAGGVTWQLRGVQQQLQAVQQQVAGLAERATTAEDQLRICAQEVTRIRIEQKAGQAGPQALLEKLQAYAPILVSARSTQPDFEAARQEMDAVLRAFQSIGADAYPMLLRRFDALQPKQSFDEMKWLLEALVRCDQESGKKVATEVLLGARKPSPRLRWTAADLLLRVDLPLAQRSLRTILLTETSRGVDPSRAMAYNLPLLDPAATAVTGFHNFVLHYLRSEDPETEDTLVQVLVRTDQDVATLQEAIEALGQRRSARAQKRIEELYLHPPGASQNAIFLNKCLDALAAIRGEAARAWLEEQLATAQHELVQQHIRHLLEHLGDK